jgi:glycosyltransferase involved in cell wall biosynthesis
LGAVANRSGVPISVVIPVHQRPAEVSRAIRSVLAQDVQPAQIIVVDDASGDRTPDVAEALGATVIRLTKNVGAAGARNAGIAVATGTWVALLDSDDEWLPHHLSALWAATAGAHLAVAGGVLRKGAGSLGGRRHGSLRRRGEVLRSPAAVLFPENPIPLSASMLRRDVLTRLGGFDETIRYSEDFDLWLRLLEVGTIRLLGEVTVIYHLHEGQKGVSKPARQAQDAIVEAHHGRPWWRRRFGERRRAVTTWDDLRQAVRLDDHRAAARAARDLVSHPTCWVPLLMLWRYRWSLRRISARWALDGKLAQRDPIDLSARQWLLLFCRPPGAIVVRSRMNRWLASALGADAVEPG